MTAHDPDLMRRIELERADAAKRVLDDVLSEIDSMSEASNELYRRAWKKLAIRISELMRRQVF